MKKIILSPTGGLANRMRSIISATVLSRKLNRECKVVWALNNELNCRYDDLFETTSVTPAVENISSFRDLFFYADPRKKNMYMARLFQAGQYALKLSDEIGLSQYIDNPSMLEKVVDNAKGDVLIRSGIVFYDFDPDTYRSVFVPKLHIIEAARSRVDYGDNRFIGLHIRRTDNIVSTRNSPLRLFIEAMDMEIADDSSVRFYLATDDQSVKRELVDKYGDRIVTSYGPINRNTSDGIKEALTEIIALSYCSKIYGSYWSSFSEAAAIISGKSFIQLKI